MIVEMDNTTLKKEFSSTAKSVTGFFDLTSDNEEENEELEPITVDSIPGLAELIKNFEMLPTEVIPTEIIDLDSDEEPETETVHNDIDISENLEALQIVTETVIEEVTETEPQVSVNVVKEPLVSISNEDGEVAAISEPSTSMCITTTEALVPINEIIESIEEEKVQEKDVIVSNTIENIASTTVDEIIEDFATSEGTTSDGAASEGESLPEESNVINDETVVEQNHKIQELIQDTDLLEINDSSPIEKIDLVETTKIVENLPTESELPEEVVSKKSIGSVIFSMPPKIKKSVKYNLPDEIESPVKEDSSVVFSVYKNNKNLNSSSVPQQHFKKSYSKQKTINCTETNPSASKKGVKFNKETISFSDDSPDDNELFIDNRRKSKSTILEKVSYVKNNTNNKEVHSLTGTDPLVLSLDDNINKLSVCDFSTIINKNSCESDNNNLLTDTALNSNQSRCTVRSDLVDTQKKRNYSEDNFFSNIKPTFNVNNFTDRQTPTDSSPDLSHYINEQTYKREGETSLPFKKRRKISCYNDDFAIKNELVSYKPPSTPPILTKDNTKTELDPVIILNDENDGLGYPAHTMMSIACLDYNQMPTYEYLQQTPQNNPSDVFTQHTRLSINPDPTNNLEQQHPNIQNDINVGYNITSLPTVINVPPHSIQYTTTYEPSDYCNYMLNFNHYHVNENHIENYIHNSKKNRQFKYNLASNLFITNSQHQTMQSSPIVTTPYQMHEPNNYSGETNSNLNKMDYMNDDESNDCNISGCTKCNMLSPSRTLRQRVNKSTRVTRSSNRTECVHAIEDDSPKPKRGGRGRGRGAGTTGRGRGRPRGSKK